MFRVFPSSVNFAECTPMTTNVSGKSVSRRSIHGKSRMQLMQP